MTSYMEGKWAWYEHTKDFLLTYYMSYNEWISTIEETDTVSLYIIQSKWIYNYIAIYIIFIFDQPPCPHRVLIVGWWCYNTTT